MDFPSELRVLCHQLSCTPPGELPGLTPTLLSHVLRCQRPLSSSAEDGSKADPSGSSVLVHKLKTHLTTFLNGKHAEERFAAAVLIKAMVEVGGWEVLRGSERWVRGLLSILGKSESSAVKETCIISLTKIYVMTHEYQTLLREITTPTLPSFVTSCLSMVSSKSSVRGPSSLLEIVLQCFATLLSRHTTIFRPFTSQIQVLVRPFLAPTQSDGFLVSSSSKDHARHLAVLLHQTAPKNTGGEEWSKALRELVKQVHMTADQVFRAVVEDWESTAGYVAPSIDINQQLCGGARTTEDLPRWNGITAGIERLVGLLGLMQEYFKAETSFSVYIPLGLIFDMITRILSVQMPSVPPQKYERGTARINPAIDREERDGLSCGLPQIHVAVLKLVNKMAERLGENFMSMAQGGLELATWVFPSGKHYPQFRLVIYQLIGKLLSLNGPSLEKSQTLALFPVIRSACSDLYDTELSPESSKSGTRTGSTFSPGTNASTTRIHSGTLNWSGTRQLRQTNNEIVNTASGLLPLLLSHIPQEHLDIGIRSLIERTAILSHNKDAMLASILNPFIGKNSKAMPSILPHLTRDFQNDAIVEILLRPRMPLVPSTTVQLSQDNVMEEDSLNHNEEVLDSPMDMVVEPPQIAGLLEEVVQNLRPNVPNDTSHLNNITPDHHVFGSMPTASTLSMTSNESKHLPIPAAELASAPAPTPTGKARVDITFMEENDASDDESVHLTMQLDTESDTD